MMMECRSLTQNWISDNMYIQNKFEFEIILIKILIELGWL